MTRTLVAATLLVISGCTSVLRMPLVATPAGAVPSSPPETSVPLAEVPWPAVRSRVLPNGMSLFVATRPADPEVLFVARVRGAGESQSPATGGIASLTAMMMRRGSRNAAGELFWPFAGLDAGNSFSWTRHYMQLSADCPPSAALDTVAAMARTLRYPGFDARWLDLEREQQLVSLRESQAPTGRAYASLGRVLFGEMSPFARSGWGEPNYLTRVTPADLAAFHASHYVPENTSLVVIGPIEAEAAFRYAELAFGDWSRGAGATAPLEVTPSNRVRPWEVLALPSDHAEVFFAIPYSLRTDDDRAAFDVLSLLYGGMFDSWLNVALREADGSTYFTTATSFGTETEGALVTHAVVALDRVESVVVRMRTVADRLVRGEVVDADLEFARPLLRTQWIDTVRDAYGTAATLADSRGALDGYAARYARSRAMDTTTLSESARRIFRSEGEALVLAGPAATLTQVARRAWEPEVTPTLISIPPPPRATPRIPSPPRTAARTGTRNGPPR